MDRAYEIDHKKARSFLISASLLLRTLWVFKESDEPHQGHFAFRRANPKRSRRFRISKWHNYCFRNSRLFP